MKQTKTPIAVLKHDAERMLEDIGQKVVEWDPRPLWTSGKTLVLGATTAEGTIVVQKKNMSKERLAKRVAVLAEAKSALECFTDVSVPSVLAHDLDRRIVIMSRAPGVTVTQFLVAKSKTTKAYPDCLWVFEASARALAIFHCSMPSDSSRNVRLHLDFGPQNLLVDERNRCLTLIDLPDKRSYGKPEQDLGPANLEWLRLGLRRPTPSFLRALSRGRRLFLAQYGIERRGAPINFRSAHEEERRRLAQLFSVATSLLRLKYGWRRAFKSLAIVPALVVLRLILVPLQQRIESDSLLFGSKTPGVP